MAEQRARVDDDNLMDGIHIDLRPVEWIQTISTNSIAAREGRGLIVNCKVKDDHVVLSNERRLHHLSLPLANSGGMSECIFHSVPDMVRNFYTVSARPGHEIQITCASASKAGWRTWV
jgi:hypothetical protein